MPIALAILLTFVLTPPVTWLERRVGNGAAVIVVVTLVFSVLGLAGWGLARQMNHLAEDLPSYRSNIRAKIADIRGASKGGTVEKLKESLQDIQTDLGTAPTPKGTSARPVVVTSPQATGFTGFTWLGPLVGPISTASAVVVMVIFMLFERRDLRDRLIGIFGHGRLAITTKAIDEAGTRVSRQLLMQTLVNATYGVAVGVGLYFLHVPYPLVWAMLGAALRFIPYVGPGARRRCADPRQPCGAQGLERPARSRGAVHRPRALSRTSCWRRCSTPAPPACRRSRCSSRWRSGPGCGGPSDC